MGILFSNFAKNAGATQATQLRAGMGEFGEYLVQVAALLRDSHHTVHGLNTVGAHFGQHLARAAQAFQDMRLSVNGLDSAGRDVGREFGRHLVDAADLLTTHGIRMVGLNEIGRELGENFGRQLLEVAKVIKDVKVHIQGLQELGLVEFAERVNNALRDMRIKLEIGPYFFRAIMQGYDVITYIVQVALLIVVLIGLQLVRHDALWPGILAVGSGLASLVYTAVWKPRALPQLTQRHNSQPVTFTNSTQESISSAQSLEAPKDTAQPSVQEDSLCIATSDGIQQGHEPSWLADFEFPCPGHRYGTCAAIDRVWFCAGCQSRIQYGYDGNLYCPCGNAAASTYRFRCNEPSHGMSPILADSKELRQKLQTYKRPEEINLLILGESGVGKSTWINAFINYLTYDSLATAEQEGLICLIPSSFSLCDEEYQQLPKVTMRFNPAGTRVERRSKTTAASTENTDDTTQAGTQDPGTYTFPYKGRIVRLIDTPGIGDARGMEQDRKNFEKNLSHISHVKELHGICILLKPNNAKLNVMFQFCLQELLIHLHKDASRNVLFVFTNTRYTFYRPGDTLPALAELLKKNSQIEIPLSKTTMFCMDNESVRFLAVLQAGIQFSAEQREECARSWKKSVEETSRLMDYVFTLKAHQTHETIHLNDARRLILELTKPMAHISTLHKVNIKKMVDKQEELALLDKDKDAYASKLCTFKDVLDFNEVNYPRTVCTAASCMELWTDISGKERAKYKTWCHSHCFLKGVPEDTPELEALLSCTAIGDDGQCKNCGCNYRLHKHVKYDCRVVSVPFTDQTVYSLLQQKNGHILAAKAVIHQCKAEEEALQNELDIITSIASKFAHFLKVNAMSVYNDALDEYLRQLINEEQQKVAAGCDRQTLEACKEMLQRYTHERRVLEEACNSAGGTAMEFTAMSVQEDIERLHALPTSGPMFRKMEWMEQQAKRQRATYMETAYIPRKVDRPRHVQEPRQQPSSEGGFLQRAWNKFKRPWK